MCFTLDMRKRSICRWRDKVLRIHVISQISKKFISLLSCDKYIEFAKQIYNKTSQTLVDKYLRGFIVFKKVSSGTLPLAVLFF